MDYLTLHYTDNTDRVLQNIISNGPFSALELVSSIIKAQPYLNENESVFALDALYKFKGQSDSKLSSFSIDSPLKLNIINSDSDRIIISNARYILDFNHSLLSSTCKNANADIIAIEIDPDLSGFREKFTFDSNGNIAGIRRVFSDSIIPTSIPKQWPHIIYIHNSSIIKASEISHLPIDFDSFISLCTRHSLTVKSMRIAGKVYDLFECGTFLQFTDKCLEHNFLEPSKPAIIDKSSKIFGNVAFGKNVKIGKDCIIAGPCIIGDNIIIPDSTVIRKSIILYQPDCSNGKIENILIIQQDSQVKYSSDNSHETKLKKDLFRSFPLWSYPKIWKRLADIIFASAFLLASLPVFIAVAIAIKLSSPGPVFFKHNRQGLHGKEFGCTKFRTMIVGADDIQDQLRKINEVDGPQFKMDDDPRVNTIGKFLRDTGIDEFPQFINVLLGQMSVVGPRPSPEKENAFCAYWRDARLSVRPGITGLWQIKRTREEGKDFQEWVIHDTTYVKKISPWLDIKISFQTVKYLLKSFIEQF